MRSVKLLTSCAMVAAALLSSVGVSTATADPSECSDNAYGLSGFYASSTMNYYIHTSVADNNKTPLYEGRKAWNITRNNCGIADTNGFNFDYKGTASNSWTSTDGRNMLDIGTMPSYCNSPPLIADGCTAIPSHSGPTYYECDTLLRAGFVANHSNADVQGLSAHEGGHCVGLLDVYSGHSNLSMYGYSPPNPSTLDTLGRGDITGMRAFY